MTPSARSTQWVLNERDHGRCPRCRRDHNDVNPNTGKRFWRCNFCRKEQRAEAKRAYQSRIVEPERKRRVHKRKPVPKMAGVPRHISCSIYVQPRTIEATYQWRTAVWL